MVSHMSASPSCSIGHFTFLPSIARAFFSDPALTPQHAESLLCCRLRQGRAGFGLRPPCPSWGGCYGTALVVDRLRCGVTKGGRSASGRCGSIKRGPCICHARIDILAPSPNVSLPQTACPFTAFDLHRSIFHTARISLVGAVHRRLREKSGLVDD